MASDTVWCIAEFEYVDGSLLAFTARGIWCSTYDQRFLVVMVKLPCADGVRDRSKETADTIPLHEPLVAGIRLPVRCR